MGTSLNPLGYVVDDKLKAKSGAQGWDSDSDDIPKKPDKKAAKQNNWDSDSDEAPHKTKKEGTKPDNWNRAPPSNMFND